MTVSKERIIEISTTIRDHLIKQNAQAIDKGDCQYKADDGKMCAVGCLLKPELYNPEFEGIGLDNRNLIDALNVSLDVNITFHLPSQLHQLLGEWQGYHDFEFLEWLEDRPGNPLSPNQMHDKLIGELK